MSYYKIDGSILTDIADAIRSQNGTVAPILTTDMASNILSIPTGGDNGNFKLEIEAIDYYSLSDTQCSALKPYCFYSDPKITGVNFENVLLIGSAAFYSCTSLATASFPKCEYVGSNAFYNTVITEFSAPSCAWIGTNAFQNCRQLSEVTFGSLTKIDDAAFNNNCSALQKVTFEYCASIGSNAFTGCSNLSKVEGILSRAYKEAFANCSRLTSFNFESMDYIGTNTFSNTGFTSIELPILSSFFNSATFAGCKSLCSASFPILTAISNNTFDGCILLSDFYAPNVSMISTAAFQNTNLPQVTDTIFPLITSVQTYTFRSCKLTLLSHQSITTIQSYAFQDCTLLTKIDLPAIKTINSAAFSNCAVLSDVNVSNASKIEMDTFCNCPSLSEINLQNVYYLSARAFMNCTNLERITVGDNFSDTTSTNYGDIGISAFYNCTKLSEVTNLSYGRYIGQAAFYKTLFSELCFLSLRSWSTNGQQFLSCSLLTTVSISGNGITKIYSAAFANCTKLTSLYLLKPTMLTLDKSAKQIFNNSPLQPGGLEIDGVTYYGSIYVPEDLYNSYIQNASWKVIETSHPGTFVSIPALQ